MKYYLTDTTPENGCLKVIPRTHRKRIDLHDKLLHASKLGNVLKPGSESKEKYSVMFNDHPDQVGCLRQSRFISDARCTPSTFRPKKRYRQKTHNASRMD